MGTLPCRNQNQGVPLGGALRVCPHPTSELEPAHEFFYLKMGGSIRGRLQFGRKTRFFFAESQHQHGTNRESNGAREHGGVILIIRHR